VRDTARKLLLYSPNVILRCVTSLCWGRSSCPAPALPALEWRPSPDSGEGGVAVSRTPAVTAMS